MSSSRIPEPEYLDIAGHATRASISVRTIRKFVNEPDGPIHFRLRGTGKILIKIVDFDEWLSRYKQVPGNFDQIAGDIISEFKASRKKDR